MSPPTASTERLLDWTDGEDRLVVTTCALCRNHWYLPREHCPVCGSRENQQAPADGAGLCVAVTRLHITAEAEDGPVRLVLVELDEGPLVLGRVHDEDLVPGDRARVSFRPVGRGRSVVPSFARERHTP